MDCKKCAGNGYVDYTGFSLDVCDICEWVTQGCPEGVSGKPQEVAALVFRYRESVSVIQEAVRLYGRPGGPWSVPDDPGGWLSRARAVLGHLPELNECAASAMLLSTARQGVALIERMIQGKTPTLEALRSFSDNARAAIAAAIGDP